MVPPSVVEGDIAIPALAGAGRSGAVIGAPGRKFLADNAAVLSAANEDGDDDGDNDNVQHRRPSRLEPRGTLHAPSILVNRWLWSVSNHIFINLLSAVYKHTRRVHLISFIYTDGFSAVSMLIAGAVMVTRNR